MNPLPPRPRFYSFLLHMPPPAVAWSVSLGALAVVAALNLGPLAGQAASVAYVLPLILCLWTRNRMILYLTAVIGSVLGYYKTVHVSMYNGYEDRLLTWWFQLINLWVPAFAIHLASYSFDRLDMKRKLLAEANDELAATNREVASREHEVVQQNEELQSQSEELERQTEELRQQAEELEQQTVELHAANDELTRRERGLQTLLESARWLRSDLAERDVMSAVCQAAVQVMEEGVSAAAVVFPQNGLLTLRGHFGFGVHGTMRADVPFPGTFAAMVMARGQTAYIADIQSRPDLNLAQPAAGRLFRSVLSTPLTVEGKVIGAVEVYAQQPREWTDGEFKVIEWLAAQCALALQAIEYQQEVLVKRREAEEASVQKTRFLAAVSHDVRTPANAISLIADLIEQSAAVPGHHVDIPNLAKDLKANARSLVELVSDVLDLTRLDSGKPDLHISDVALHGLLKTSLRQFERIAVEKKLDLRLESGNADVVLRTDKMKLARIFANLLGNAVKFTEAGAVALRSRMLPDGGVAISVADTGVGIPADALGRIFDEFYQLQNPERDRNKGSGLGLAICKRLVTALGFTLNLESTVGVGSTFTVTIPREFVQPNTPKPVEMVETPKGDAGTLRDVRVLLVEDHDVTRRAASRLLATRGATVLEARTGREALHLLLHDQPDVLLLDLMLPDADGTDILKHLKLNRPASLRCVLAVSGDVRDARRKEVKDLGAYDLIAKPLDIQHLLNAIVTGLERCQGGDGHKGDGKVGAAALG